MAPYPQDTDFSELSTKQLAEIGIFTPVERRYDNQENAYWIVSNQKIVAVDPDLPGLREYIVRQNQDDDAAAGRGRAASQEQQVITRPPALENSLNNFFRSLFDLLAAWLRWLFGSKADEGGDTPRSKKPRVDGNGTFRWTFKGSSGKKVDFRIVRVNECFNDAAEFGGKPSVNLLLEWNQSAGQGDLLDFVQLHAQADNHFISNPHPPSHRPQPPIDANTTITRVYDTDFRKLEHRDKIHYTRESEEPVVAVMDTGLKYKWDPPAAPLKDSAKNDFQFKIAQAPGGICLPGASFGYCSISDYLRKPAPAFRQLAALAPLSVADIRSSPYDDHRVDEQVEGEKTIREKVGRHGTFITAILNHHGCQVLPIKSFNCAARGTLFDVLDGLNYLISCKQKGMPIKVLNASFSGNLDDTGLKLFYQKLKVLTDLGVWVVASAGNEGVSLDGSAVYPAQFSLSGSRYFLEKVITVNSEYDGGVQGNTGAAVAVRAKSPAAGGFPSVIPIQGSPADVIQGTSFAAPYVACALAAVDTTGLSRNEVLNRIAAQNIGGITFIKTA